MQQHSYWRTQTPAQPLFPDIAWSKPEQRNLAGRLGIIGGNKLGFMGVAEGYSASLKAGIGEARALLPDALKKTVPPVITDVIFAASNPSGGLAAEAITEMRVLGSWAQTTLLIGDAGKNSETAILYETFITDYEGPLVIARDAVDLLRNNAELLLGRPHTLLIVSFAQLQKLFQAIYFPKVLTFSMHLAQLVDALHKFTLSYPVHVAVLHRETLIVASGGAVTTTPWGNPMALWRGTMPATAAAFWTWNPTKPLEAITASLLD